MCSWMRDGTEMKAARWKESWCVTRTQKALGIVLRYHSGMGREKDTVSMANLFAFPDERKKELQRIKAGV